MREMICTVCNTISKFDDCLNFWQVWHDEVHATEHFAGMRCPECGADGEFLKEVATCKHCQNDFEPGTLIAGELCEDCYKWTVRNQPYLVLEFLEDNDLKDEFAEFAASKM